MSLKKVALLRKLSIGPLNQNWVRSIPWKIRQKGMENGKSDRKEWLRVWAIYNFLKQM